ncbi:MAG: hypothetical protein RR463_09540 [Hydrogenoanaerobacterium sp.]
MNRLTMPNDKGMCLCNGEVCCPDENCSDACLQERMSKLWKYENAEELGLIVRLPCKQYTTVYYIMRNRLAVGRYLAKVTENVILILTDRQGGICWCNDDTWFYTIEAAVKALAESEGDNA